MRQKSENPAALISPAEISAAFRNLENDNIIRDADNAIEGKLKTLENQKESQLKEPPISAETFASQLQLSPKPKLGNGDKFRTSTPLSCTPKSEDKLSESLFLSWDTWNNAGRALSIEEALQDQAADEPSTSRKGDEAVANTVMN